MKKTLHVLVAILLLCAGIPAGCATPDQNANNPAVQGYWPVGDWRASTPEEQGMDSQKLADMINAIGANGISINSVTIIRNGYMVDDTYFYPYQKEFRHAANSETKSFLSALAGIAMEEGDIKGVDGKVLDYFKDQAVANVDQRKQRLTIRNLMTMTTGLDWQFDGNVSTQQMLQSQNWTNFTLDLPMKEDPGRTFNYCNGASNVLSAIIQKTTGKSAFDYAAEKLAPLGMRDLFWSADPEGVSTGYSGIYIYPEDAAKFGYLYLRDGEWDGKQVVPKKWIEESTTKQANGSWNPIFPGYGYMWWTNRFGGYAALGFGGNYIFVVPKLDLVVVFTGGIFNNADLFYPGELMEQYVLPAVKSKTALAANQEASDSLKQAIDRVQNPHATAAPPLPTLAKKISGKTYNLATGDITTPVTLYFNEGDSEFTIDLDSKSKKVGLDNVYRISHEANAFGTLPDSHKADKGLWVDGDTLKVVERDLEDGFDTVFTIDFEGDHIALHAQYSLGYEVTYTGELAK
jgi:CubicO group peptidase (beta-lactamase class C family)